MHKVYSHLNPALVQLAKNELEQLGIEAVVQGEHLAAVAGGGAAADAWHELWIVDGERLREAAEVVREVIGDEDEEVPEPWTCPQCGEEVAGTFAVCWNCGHAPSPAGAV
jgi:rubrerythrin